MNSQLIKILIFITFTSMTISCVDKKSDMTKTFPFSEKDMMVNNGMIGALLEYAIFDSTKIEFVKENICDSISNKNDFVFSKIETIINDSSFFFYHYHQNEHITFDYFGVIYLPKFNK